MTIPNRIQTKFLMLWHATLSGGFIVAYVGQDLYAVHLFAGYVVLAAVVVRVLVGWLARPKSPLALTNPLQATRAWLDKFNTGAKGRNPLLAWIAAALLLSIGLAALTGAMADGLSVFKHLHEGIAEFTPVVVFAHIAFVAFKPLKAYLLSVSLPLKASLLHSARR